MNEKQDLEFCGACGGWVCATNAEIGIGQDGQLEIICETCRQALLAIVVKEGDNG